MKELKYIKFFEAFESDKLSKTFGFLNKESQERFLIRLKRYLNKIDFPYSEISDEFIEYLPFNAALKKSAMATDEVCETTSNQAFPEHGIDGEKCEKGKIKRRWVKSIRTATCPVCDGTGIKKKREGEIKLIKYWFTKEGRYVATTAVDGVVRGGNTRDKSLSTDISDYIVGERLSVDQVLALKKGTIISATLGNGRTRRSVCYIYKYGTRREVWALNNDEAGDTPPDNEWRKFSHYSWGMYSGSFRDARLLTLKDDVGDEVINPYTWNSPVDNYANIPRRRYVDDVKDSIKDAHFALVIDASKLSKTDYSRLTRTRDKRTTAKKGAFLTDNEVRDINIARYLDKISKGMNITDDVKNINRLIKRLLRFRFAIFSMVAGNLPNKIGPILNEYYSLLRTEDESYKKSYISNIQDRIDSIMSGLKNSNVRKTVEEIKSTLKTNGHTSHLELFEEVLKVSSLIYDRITEIDIETIEDLETVNQRIISIKSVLSRGRYKISDISYFLQYVYNSNTRSSLSSILGESDKDVKAILDDMDRLKKVISKI